MTALSTGALRAILQRITFLRLTEDHGPGFTAGTVVAAQYWGAGQVVLTRYPDGHTMTPVAHQVHGELIPVEPGDTPAYRRTGVTDREAAGPVTAADVAKANALLDQVASETPAQRAARLGLNRGLSAAFRTLADADEARTIDQVGPVHVEVQPRFNQDEAAALAGLDEVNLAQIAAENARQLAPGLPDTLTGVRHMEPVPVGSQSLDDLAAGHPPVREGNVGLDAPADEGFAGTAYRQPPTLGEPGGAE